MSAADRPPARRDFAHWPVPVGRVESRHGVTFVHSVEPGGFTVDDLRKIPDGRVELRKGVLVARPDLPPEHRQVMSGLYRDLCEACPEHLAPSDGRLDLRRRRPPEESQRRARLTGHERLLPRVTW